MRPTTRRHTQGVLFTILSAFVLAASGCDDGNPVAPGSPGGPPQASPQSITIAGNTALRHPGDIGQLVATVTFSDGTSRNVSAEALWNADHSEIVAVRDGVITARAYGECHVRVVYQSLSAVVPVTVWPEGMFKLTGRVTAENGQTLPSAQITITPSFGEPGVRTNVAGQYLVPARGDVEVRAEFAGFEPQVRRVTVSGDMTVDFQLLPVKTGGFGGVYTLVFAAAPSCALPPEAMRREYTVKVLEHASGRLTVDVLSPEMVAWGAAGFTGVRLGSVVMFEMTDDFMSEYTFVELLDSGRELAFSGSASGEIAATVAVTFDGTVTVRSRVGATISQCDAADHQFTFTR